jgi:hypothetical protein
MTTKETVHAYYTAWADQERKKARELLAEAFQFDAPQFTFDNADTFLDSCWQYSDELSGVKFLYEVYDGDQAFVILLWSMEDGTTFAGAEYVTVADGKVTRILVVNNDPSIKDLLKLEE